MSQPFWLKPNCPSVFSLTIIILTFKGLGWVQAIPQVFWAPQHWSEWPLEERHFCHRNVSSIFLCLPSTYNEVQCCSCCHLHADRATFLSLYRERIKGTELGMIQNMFLKTQQPSELETIFNSWQVWIPSPIQVGGYLRETVLWGN